MTLIKALDKDDVLPKKKEYDPYDRIPIIQVRPHINGFNECVSQNDKLALLIDEEDLAFALFQYIYPTQIMKNDLWEEKKYDYVQEAKHLKSTMAIWAKLGIEK